MSCCNFRFLLFSPLFLKQEMRKAFCRESTNQNKKFSKTKRCISIHNWPDNAFKGTVKEKWKGVQTKTKHYRSWSRPLRVLSDIPVSKNWLVLAKCKYYYQLYLLKMKNC